MPGYYILAITLVFTIMIFTAHFLAHLAKCANMSRKFRMKLDNSNDYLFLLCIAAVFLTSGFYSETYFCYLKVAYSSRPGVKTR